MFLLRLFFGSMAVLCGPFLTGWTLYSYFEEHHPDSIGTVIWRSFYGMLMLSVGIGWLRPPAAKPKGVQPK